MDNITISTETFGNTNTVFLLSLSISFFIALLGRILPNQGGLIGSGRRWNFSILLENPAQKEKNPQETLK